MVFRKYVVIVCTMDLCVVLTINEENINLSSFAKMSLTFFYVINTRMSNY